MIYWIKDEKNNVLAKATTQVEALEIMNDLAYKTKKTLTAYTRFRNHLSDRWSIEPVCSITPMCNLYFDKGEGFQMWQESSLSYKEAKEIIKNLHSTLSKIWNVELTWKMVKA